MATDSEDPFNLQRFVEAQARDHAQALRELRAGRKTSHWIWYVLPQLRGLGASPMSQFYGIADALEAKAYLAHPVLGPRLRECVSAMNDHAGRSAVDILGAVDALKFRSCLTLFGAVAPQDGLFARALANFFDGEGDPQTLSRLCAPGDSRT